MKIISNFFLYVFLAALNVLIWTYVNKPFHPVNSQYPFSGMCFSPFKKNQNPEQGITFQREDLYNDVKLLSDKTKVLSVYTARNGIEHLPAIAKEFNMDLIVTAWLDKNLGMETNQAEFDAAINLAKYNRNVKRLIIGNETQLHKIFSREDLINYLDTARKRLKTPVSTAEPWDFWINNPDMVNHVDYIAIHILPYWVGIPIDQAADYVIGKYFAVKNTFPDKKVVITEVGWPSEGPQRGAAVPSLVNQAMFIRSFVRLAIENKIDYDIMEAFDQPWKGDNETRVGGYWGVMNADRQDKFPLDGPVFEDPNWKYWTGTACILGLLSTMIFLYRRYQTRFHIRLLSSILIQILVSMGLGVLRQATDEYLSPGQIVFWCFVFVGQVLLAIIFIADTRDIADVVGRKPLKRQFLPSRGHREGENAPFVSVHVACCKEPPELMIQTLNSLARLNYPNFEVMVIDNNTPDPALWQPLQEHCQKLGPRFRFFTLGKHPGFKAGALNFALKNIDPRTEVIGVVDADYIVDTEWLNATVPYFKDPEVSVVQAPQEHREWEDNIYHRMENDAYTGFFRIGMVQRNEDNAIIQHGTMTLIRASTMKELQGWAEWCICEDSELGLRILKLHKKIIYIDHPMGWGLVPDTYAAFSKQIYRWAYGGMRIFRHHIWQFFGFRSKLTMRQRYHFVSGWMLWWGTALHMIFTFSALFWNVVLMRQPEFPDFPETVLLYPFIALFLVRIFGVLWTYRARVPISRRRTLLAMLTGSSLTHKVAKAVFMGLFTSSLPFHITPKTRSKSALFKALLFVREEILLGLLLILSGSWVIWHFGIVNYQATLWGITCMIQATPYVAAIAVSLLSLQNKATTAPLVANNPI